MNNRFLFRHQPWGEFEETLHQVGLSPLAFCRLTNVASGAMQRWCDGTVQVPILPTLLLKCMPIPAARAAINEESNRRILLDKLTGEKFNEAQVERMRR
jgi:hypothetical protein